MPEKRTYYNHEDNDSEQRNFDTLTEKCGMINTETYCYSRGYTVYDKLQQTGRWTEVMHKKYHQIPSLAPVLR